METITACENVCRDFSWLNIFGPWVGPATIAAITALIIAFIAYPWQKQKDRDLQILAEKRKLYAEFLNSLAEYEIRSQKMTETFAELQHIHDQSYTCMSCIQKMVLYAPKTVIELAWAHFCALDRYLGEQRKMADHDDLREKSARKERDETAVTLFSELRVDLGSSDGQTNVAVAEFVSKEIYGINK